MHRPGWTFQCNGAVGCGGAISGSESVLGTAARPTGAGDSLSDRGKCMWVWRKAHGEARETSTVARSAVEGKPRHLLREAVKTLLASGRADRVGVWIESVEGDSGDLSEAASFRGIVADKDGDATPAEWSRLSPEAPLPVELSIGLQTVEQEPAGAPGGPLIGAVVEMQSALWVPVQMPRHPRGGLFSRRAQKQARFPPTPPATPPA